MLTFRCDNHYQLSNAMWVRDLCTSLAVWWIKLEKNDKVRHIMTQIASLLAVATVFIYILTQFYSRGGGGEEGGAYTNSTISRDSTVL